MNKTELISSAKKLTMPSKEAFSEFQQKRDLLAENVTQALIGRPDLEKLIGPDNLAMMKDNHKNHARFIESIFATYSPEVLVETVLWVFRAYRSHGFLLAYWPAQLNAWVEVFKENLTTKTFNEVYPLYNWMIINQPFFVSLSESGELATPNHGEAAK